MFRKTLLFIIFTVTATLAVSFSVNAQTAPLGGTVVLQKDGKAEPVASASVDVYRTDVKGFYSTKTDKKGEFRFVGVQYGDYVIAVRAPNCAPITYPNVRAGQENIHIVMGPGDGRKYTEAEAKADTSKSGETGSGMSDEEKNAQAELAAKNAEITAKNEKLKASDAIATKSYTEGNAALEAKNYDLAITKFSEGIAAVPDYVGSTPALLNGKMLALKLKGVGIYKEGAPLTDAAAKKAKFEEANRLMDDALAAFQNAVAIIKKAATDPANPADPKTQSVSKALYAEATEIHRLKAISGVDLTKGAEATAVITEYIAIEPDPARKLSAHLVLGDIMRKTGDFEKAVEAYRQVLVLKPDHAEATGWLGLSLFGLGSATADKAKEQEGLNYMQKYIDMAPVSSTDSPQTKELKESIKQAVDYLKNEQKLAPQKVPAAPKKK